MGGMGGVVGWWGGGVVGAATKEGWGGESRASKSFMDVGCLVSVSLFVTFLNG